MAFYFGSGERFKENDENNPGPGDYSPRQIEGFKADPKSPFLGQERFAALMKEEGVPELEILRKSNVFKSSPKTLDGPLKQKEKSRQYSWSTMRIAELQEELQTVKAFSKAVQSKLDEAKRKQEADLTRMDSLVKAAEKKEHEAQTQLRICQEEIEDQKTNLFKEREASAHSENQQKLLIAQLAELEAEFQKSQEECSQQISELQDRVNRSNEDNEAHSKHFNLLVSSLGFPPGNTEEIVGAAIDTFLRLKQEIIDLKATEVDSKTRLQTTQTELNSLKKEQETLLDDKSRLENQCCDLEIKFSQSQSELDFLTRSSAEKFEMLEKSQKDQENTLNQRISDITLDLQKEIASCKSLGIQLEHTTAECENCQAKLDLQSIQYNDLKTEHGSLEADFDQYKQAARSKYEQVLTSFKNENQVCAQVTADLSSKSTECDTLLKTLEEANSSHEKEVSSKDELLASLQNKVETLESSLKNVEDKLETSITNAHTLERDNTRFSKELESIGNKAQEFESLSTSLREKLDQTKAECDLAQSNLQQSTQSKESLASDFTALKEEAARKATLLHSKLVNLETRTSHLETELNNAAEQNVNLEQELSDALEKLNSAESEVKSLQHEIALFELEKAKQSAEIDSLSLQLAEKKSNLEESIQKLNEVEIAKDDLSKTHLELKIQYEDLVHESEALKLENEGQKAKREVAESEYQKVIAALETCAKNLDSRTKECDSEKQISSDLKTQNDSLQAELSERIQKLEVLTKFSQDFESFKVKTKEDTNSFVKQLKDASDSLEEFKEKETASQAKLEKLLDEKASVTIQISNLSEEKEEVLKKLRSANENIGDLKESLSSKDLEIHTNQLELNQMRSDRENLGQKIKDLHVDLEREAQINSDTKLLFEEKEVEVQSQRKDISELQRKNLALNEEAKNLGQQLSEKDAAHLSLESKSQELKEEILALQAFSDSQAQALEKLEEKLASMQSKLADSNSFPESPNAFIRSNGDGENSSRLSIDRINGEHEMDVSNLQAQNLEMFECLHEMEQRCVSAEATASRKDSQVAQLQERLIELEEAALSGHFEATEAQRLADENTLLAAQMKQMEVNVKELVDTHGLGHSNNKQRIQYHLRLKEELEELRHECMVLLRERFQLEQCIRYLAAISTTRSLRPEIEFRPVTGQKPSVQPSSLTQVHSWITPSRRASLLRSSRGIGSIKNGTSAPSKEELLTSIHQAVRRTSDSVNNLANDFQIQADCSSTPRRMTSSSGSHASEATEGSQNGFVKEQQSIDKLLAKIADICSPNKTGRTSALMREHAQIKSSVVTEDSNLTPRQSGKPNQILLQTPGSHKWKI